MSVLRLILLTIFAACSAVALPDSRIVGGSSTNLSEAPYTVQVRHKKDDDTPFQHRCSGTIYSRRVVLTTAICVVGIEKQHLHVLAGSNYRTQGAGYLHPVERIVIHPDFNIWFMDNDLALLQLAFELTESKPNIIAPIALASELPESGSAATIVGWGETGLDVPFSETLQLAEVQVVADATCKSAYGERRISKAMICAASGTDDSYIDACLGDAGGALVVRGAAVGLVSWGSGCGRRDFPGVYTNLVHLKPWIEKAVEEA